MTLDFVLVFAIPISINKAIRSLVFKNHHVSNYIYYKVLTFMSTFVDVNVAKLFHEQMLISIFETFKIILAYY